MANSAPSDTDYAELASHRTRKEFINECEFLFLLSLEPGSKTTKLDFADEASFTKPGEEPENKGSVPRVVAVRKVQPMFPSMITVGRTTNNDVPLLSPQISKFHAYFRVLGGRI